MATLHVFASFQSFQRALPVVGALNEDDSVLVRADALYELVGDTQFGPRCYAIKADALARGLDPAQFHSIRWIDYDDWVDLVLSHQASVDW